MLLGSDGFAGEHLPLSHTISTHAEIHKFIMLSRFQLTITNVLSLYRGAESYIDLEQDKLVTNTTFEVKNLTINLDWEAKKWFVTLDGTAQLNLESISINTVIGVEGVKVVLLDAEVPEIGHINVTDVTGTSSVFNGLVRSVVEKIVNTDSTKKTITDQVDQSIRDIFSKIFK